MINWILNKTENAREWIAFKIYPEIDLYIEVAKHLGEINETSRTLNMLRKEDSVCSDWAIEVLGFNDYPGKDIMDKLKDEFGEHPF